MKVFVVVPYLTTYGGAARFAWEVSEYLSSRGDDVFVISLFTDKKLYKSKEKIHVIDLAKEGDFPQSKYPRFGKNI